MYNCYVGRMATPAHELPISEARAHLTDVVNRAAYAGEITLIKRGAYGKPLAAVVPMSVLDLLAKLEDRADIEAADEALAQYEAGHSKPVSHEDLWARLED
ncbi:hypothetical protein TH66_12235 [Carbonactinospora thermoautotrophica]|uniref:Antitoxin n=2 Tax=Carbonactinospora thermoautotrophica TaxID=1469144 RepID=A0A132N0M4_9ACTN|nr:hypothetical protein TH66_12235 [Carbonactinospora thermoautotrophica]KWX07559.1 hypothetical protein TR74_18395 [Carbonactinospora thermoautotrophica]